MNRPAENEYLSYYNNYIKLVPQGNIVALMEKQNTQFCEYLAQVSEEKAGYRYAEGKWSLKEVIGHLIDVELIFLYRALRVSRNDQTLIPGFEQDDYVANGNYDEQDLSSLVEQFFHVRRSSVSLFKSFKDAMWTNTGNANGHTISTRAIAFIMVGHVIHHMQIIQKRYLS